MNARLNTKPNGPMGAQKEDRTDAPMGAGWAECIRLGRRRAWQEADLPAQVRRGETYVLARTPICPNPELCVKWV